MGKERRHFGNTTRLSGLVERIQAGDESAREELIKESQGRLRRLASKMLKGFPGVRLAAHQTDDILQPVLAKLYQALDAVGPMSGRHFVNLAAEKIRRELIDLARKYRKEIGEQKARRDLAPSSITSPKESVSLDEWTAFHEAVGRLPDDEKAVFKLKYYGAWKRQEIAVLLGIDEKTVTKRFGMAKERLTASMN